MTDSNLEHQDWEPVTFNKNKHKSEDQRTHTQVSNDRLTVRALDVDEGVKRPSITKSMQARIISARTNSKKNRKEFARSLNVKESDVTSWETGKTKPNEQQLRQLNKVYKF